MILEVSVVSRITSIVMSRDPLNYGNGHLAMSSVKGRYGRDPQLHTFNVGVLKPVICNTCSIRMVVKYLDAANSR